MIVQLNWEVSMKRRNKRVPEWLEVLVSFLASCFKNFRFWLGIAVGYLLWAVVHAAMASVCLSHGWLC
jgi:hypothetical protein